MSKQQGGAEIPVSLLFADVRGSTSLAESMSPMEFARTMDDFFHLVARAVDAENGVIDHIVGDGVMAMWIPAFVGADHARHAVDAGRALIAELRKTSAAGGAFPAGVGVHTGIGYVGVIGNPGSYDFTVQGDVANTTARLGSAAGNGDLILSDSVVSQAQLPTDGLTRRMLDLKGKAQPVPAWVESAPHGASPSAANP